ncbi:hypothetical protein HPG69_010254, partial [Diceros bicornis minor]
VNHASPRKHYERFFQKLSLNTMVTCHKGNMLVNENSNVNIIMAVLKPNAMNLNYPPSGSGIYRSFPLKDNTEFVSLEVGETTNSN